MIDLFRFWRREVLPTLLPQRPAISSGHIDDGAVQASIEFATPPNIVFVRDFKDFAPVARYAELPTLELTSEVQAHVQAAQTRIKYNGMHIMLRGLVYDPLANNLYLDAVRVDYAFINCLQAGKFQGTEIGNLGLFQSGVYAPLITQDQYTVLLRKAKPAAWQMYSVNGGFLECESFSQSLSGLVDSVAVSELKDESLLDANTPPQLRIAMGSRALKALSITQVREGWSMLEFVVPTELKCTHSRLQYVLTSNQAPDRAEHTQASPDDADRFFVPLAASMRTEATAVLARKLHGPSLYAPNISACAIVANRFYRDKSGENDFVSRTLPHTRTAIFSASLFAGFFKLAKCISTSGERQLARAICDKANQRTQEWLWPLRPKQKQTSSLRHKTYVDLQKLAPEHIVQAPQYSGR